MSDKQDFTIKDRRVFRGTPEEDAPPETEPSISGTEEAAETVEHETASDGNAEEGQLPEISFATFILSLNASALVNLGAIDDPTSGTKSKNLMVGKQTIDILSMLEEKTRGNVTEDEAQMLKSILYELRMLYVKEKG